MTRILSGLETPRDSDSGTHRFVDYYIYYVDRMDKQFSTF
jgi:hypothetical protein